VMFVTGVSIVGKFLGAWLGAFGPGLSREDRLSVGIAFTPSGVTGIVVAGVALEAGILSTQVFVAIVFSTLASSLLVGPALLWSIRRRREPGVLDTFSRESMRPVLAGADREAVIRELCESVSAHTSVGEAAVLNHAVREREELMGTATGHGIAVPHARIPGLRRAVWTFGRSVSGVDWDAPDGRRVRLVFLILTPEGEAGLQLQILSELAQGLLEGPARERLLQAATTDTAYEALAAALPQDARA
jgi:mannitol/fructose-specific phosphotransferase system IIA component (Ntr-type)